MTVDVKRCTRGIAKNARATRHSGRVARGPPRLACKGRPDDMRMSHGSQKFDEWYYPEHGAQRASIGRRQPGEWIDHMKELVLVRQVLRSTQEQKVNSSAPQAITSAVPKLHCCLAA